MTHSTLGRRGVVLAVCLAVVASLSVPAEAVTFSSISDLTAAGTDALDPEVAVSTDGSRATAVWLRTEGGDDLVQTRSATVVGGTAQWGPVATLSAPGADASSPEVAVSTDGTRATVVWSRYNGTTWVIQSRSAIVIGDNSQWGAISQLSSNSLLGDVAENPQVDLSNDGQIALTAWQRGQDGSQRIESAAAAVAGLVATWEPPKNDVSAAGGDAVDPQVRISDTGIRGTVVWRRAQGADPDHQIQSRSGGTSQIGWVWGGTLSLSDISRNATEPQLALSGDGLAATLVWVWDNGSNKVVQSHSLVITGVDSFAGATQTLSAAGQDAVGPSVAVSSTGATAVAVWSRATGTGDRLIQSAHAGVSAGSATWGSVGDVTHGGFAWVPQVALAADGSVSSAIWMVLGGEGNYIEAASGAVTGNAVTWAATQPLTEVTGNAADPHIGVSTDGQRATAVWAHIVGNNDSVIQSASAGQAQTITFPAVADTRVDRGPVALGATASSGLAVTYASLSPLVCQIQGAAVSLSAVGTCTVEATQEGNDAFLAAAPVRQSFEVTAVPVPGPGRQTSLTVKARKAGKKLVLRKKAVVVRSVTTDGVITERTGACLRKGRVAPKACKVKRPAGRILITPRCTTKVKAEVTITAQAPGAEATTFTRTWRVKPKPRKAC